MRALKTTLTLALSLAVIAGCDDDDDFTGVDDDLVGDFEATTVEFESRADPDVTTDVVQDGGEFTLSLRESGTFESSFRDPTGARFDQEGTFTVRGNEVEFDDDFFLDDDVVTPRTFTVEGGTTAPPLRMETDVAEFDVEGTGEVVDARLRMELDETT